MLRGLHYELAAQNFFGYHDDFVLLKVVFISLQVEKTTERHLLARVPAGA